LLLQRERIELLAQLSLHCQGLLITLAEELRQPPPDRDHVTRELLAAFVVGIRERGLRSP
jgi:hypothetical protein